MIVKGCWNYSQGSELLIFVETTVKMVELMWNWLELQLRLGNFCQKNYSADDGLLNVQWKLA